MKNEITLTNPTLLRINDAGMNSTVYSILPATALKLQKSSVDDYRKQARHLLDGLSNEYNAIGIEGVIAAMLIETLGNDYNGKMNK